MIRRTSQPLAAWFLLWDVALTAAAWVAAYWLRFDSGLFPVNRGVPDLPLYLGTLPLVLLVAVAFRVAGMYEVHRLRRFREELVAVGEGRRADGAARSWPRTSPGSSSTSRGLAMVMFAAGRVRRRRRRPAATLDGVRRLRAAG